MYEARPSSCSAAEAGGAVTEFRAAWARRPARCAALAVSGGSDSVALLRVVAAEGGGPAVVTVDHGLRAQSGVEAAWVGGLCQALGLEHSVLRWDGAAAAANLQAAAREARYRLIAEWAAPRGIGFLATGHTLDDQAETVLMRLARGSGVDGLAAMRETTARAGLPLFRPLLRTGRAALRAYLRGLGQDWMEDPSNADMRFDRVKARQALGHLAPLGLTAERLSRTADHMARAADLIESMLDAWSADHLALPATGEARVRRSAYAALPEELRLRLLARGLGLVANRAYRPRFEALQPLAALLAGDEETTRSLHGCLVSAGPETILIVREPAAVAPPVPLGPEGGAWDGRWRVARTEGAGPGLSVGPMGEAGLSALDPAATAEEWQAAPRLARLTTPAIWRGAELVAAPLAGPAAAAGWRAERLPPAWRGGVTAPPRARRRDGSSV